MNKNYKIADFNGDQNVLQQLSQYENEMKRTTGEDIVLIAYKKDNAQ